MKALDVLLGGTRVGLLEQIDEEQVRFSFDEAWLGDPAAPLLGQIFEDRKPRPFESVGTLPCWFDHLLPPEGGPLRRAITRQIGADGDDGFALLQYLGADLPGAVVLRPGLPTLAPEPRTAPEPPEPRGPLRFALAGMQMKLSIRARDRKLTLPLQGEDGDFIAKLPSPRYEDLPRVELATMRWAALSGIEVPEIGLARVADLDELLADSSMGPGEIFLIRRFDRLPDGGRVHIEDFGQVLDRPADDHHIYGARYEHIAVFLSYLPVSELRAFCERLVFCILAGNTDAHLKNWSLIYPDGRHPRLSPAYDLVSSLLYEPPKKQSLALSLNNSHRFEDLGLEAWKPLSRVCRRPFEEVACWVREMTERVLAVWRERGEELPYLPAERVRIDEHMRRVPIAAGS